MNDFHAEHKTDVRITGDDPARVRISISKIQFWVIISVQIFGLIAACCTAFYFIMNMDYRLTIIEAERRNEKRSNAELLRLTQENNINLQSFMKKNGMEYITIPKGE